MSAETVGHGSDLDVEMLARMHDRRLKGYGAIGYVIDTGSCVNPLPSDCEESDRSARPSKVQSERQRCARYRLTFPPDTTSLHRPMLSSVARGPMHHKGRYEV